MKKILLFLFAALSIFSTTGCIELDSLFGPSENADDSNSDGVYNNSIKYIVSDDEITITGLVSYDIDYLYIPEEINGYKVTSIADESFDVSTRLSFIYIPSSVVYFENMFMMKDPSSIEFIKPIFVAYEGSTDIETISGFDFWFSNYDINDFVIIDSIIYVIENNEAKVFKVFNDATMVTILNEVSGYTLTSIGFGSFGYSNITNIEIPNSVITIESNAFMSSALVSITFEEVSSLKTIKRMAFYTCENLISITIPKSVITIEEVAFYQCSVITIYTSQSSKPTNWDDEWSVDCIIVWESDSNSDGVYNNSIKYIVSDDEITITGLVSYDIDYLYIPEEINGYKVTSIADESFDVSTRLSFIYIPSSVVYFENMFMMKDPSSIEFIKPIFVAYEGSTDIETISGFDFWFSNYDINDFVIIDSIIYVIENNEAKVFKVFNDATMVTILNEVSGYTLTSIGFGSFGYSNITNIEIPNSVITIESNAFMSSALVSITFEEVSSLKTIKRMAFYTCENLISITIPKSVITIEEVAFYQCSVITIYTSQSSKPTNWDDEWSVDCTIVWETDSN